jgi:hypothetical protein
MKTIKTLFARVGVVVAGVAASAAHAAGPDFSSLTSAVDWGTASAAVLAISAGVAGVYIIMAGAKLILGTVKKA